MKALTFLNTGSVVGTLAIVKALTFMFVRRVELILAYELEGNVSAIICANLIAGQSFARQCNRLHLC